MVSLLTLLDDIATTFDDVSVMTKIALKKTSAIMSDDLAVNSGVIHGVNPERELPIVKAIFFGSLINKVYCIVGVLLLSSFLPILLKIVLVIGGVYLCYEGAHKVAEKLFHLDSHAHEKVTVIGENEKIKGAVRTDLILSVEIIVIAKDAMSGALAQQILSLVLVGVAASVLIYGLVALLVKIDDLGLFLVKRGHPKSGLLLVNSMPHIMRLLGIVGTVAMFLVGGGIIEHTFHLSHLLPLPALLLNLVLGVITGMIALGLVSVVSKVYTKFR